MNRPMVIGIALFLIVFGTIVFVVKHRQVQQRKTASALAPAVEQPERATNTRRINVKLFFSNDNSTALVPEERSIVYQEDLHAQAQEVLQELVLGPKSKLAPTIPPKTQLRDLFISKDGIAYVDFSQDLVNEHQGGSAGEISTVYSIVNTLTLNFPQIKKVQILVEDRVIDTLKGHLDLSRPLSKDLSTLGQTVEKKAQL